jgi:uncharacterized protein (DUF1800 family)
MTTGAIIATSRFGFAARDGELGAVAGDPRGWLRFQLGKAAATLPARAAS